MRTALVHDWLITEGGGEKVLKIFTEMFPSSIYTLFHDCKKINWEVLQNKKVHTSCLQNIPFSTRIYRWLLPFFPLAIERLDVSQADMILSSSHAVAKGIQKREDQLHICYCYTPMRYVWDLQEQYLRTLPVILRKPAKACLNYLQAWDQKTADRVDAFIAISDYVAKRIDAHYKRKAKVIYPPVAVDQFFLSEQKEEYYVTHARLVPYKRIDLWVRAFSLMPDKKLIVIGEGPEMQTLKHLAKKNVEFLGYLTDKELASFLSKAKAYLFAAEEEFGIAVVEAQASGLPVIALGKGGVLEIVQEGKTGMFFPEATVASCVEAIYSFEQKQDLFDPFLIKEKAKRFAESRFKQEISMFIEEQKRIFYENCDSSRRERL